MTHGLPITNAKNELVRINAELLTPHLLIGGLAVQQYVPTRDSADIDLVCDWDVARSLVKKLYPADIWKIEDKNQDELRPSLVITHRIHAATRGAIAFGPKIIERRPYEYMDWDRLSAGAQPFRYQNRELKSILVPAVEVLAFTKLLSFIGRNRANESKIIQDLDDFVELTNDETFNYQKLYILIESSGASEEVRAKFRPNTKQHEDILARSILFKLVGDILGSRSKNKEEMHIAFTSMAAHFNRLKVPRDSDLISAGLFNVDPDRKCIGTILSVETFRGTVGVDADKIQLRETNNPIALPDYVRDQIPHTKINGRDGDKVALVGWHQQPLDVNLGITELEVVKTKYSTKVAMRQTSQRLRDDIVRRNFDLLGAHAGTTGTSKNLPCHLHCDGLVLSGDGHVILAQRGNVDIETGQWAASFGESMEWDEDRDATGALHPARTIWRGMEQELGLQEAWVRTRIGDASRITFLDLGFQIDSFIYILFALIELPGIGIAECLERARQFRTDKEPVEFRSMSLLDENCVSSVVSGAIDGRKLNYSGRFGILLASLNKIGPSFRATLERRT